MTNSTSRNQVATWLLICCALVFAMVVVGGVTRLTHSGLSIAEWQPIVGALPPLNDVQWHEAFEKYRQTPEYRKVNFGMSLEAFKGIFWMEYFHRLLGRAIGIVFLLPLLYFWASRKIDRALAWKLSGIFLLGGLQGAMGWYMVASGLVDDPRVSQYRLTAHLGMAFLIYAAMFWVALGLLRPRPFDPSTKLRTQDRRADHSDAEHAGLRRFSTGLTALIFVMVLTGGLVAGIRAGLAYNTFPLMNGHFIPPEIFMIDPWRLNFFNNMATVQFDHRLIAWLLAILVPWFWWNARRAALPSRSRLAANFLLATLAIQIALGITTLLMQVPVALAAAHQAGALALFSAALWMNHELCHNDFKSISQGID